MPCSFARVLILSNFLIVIIVFVIQGRLGFATRDTISLLSPPPKIDELAAIGAERSMGIIFPLSFSVTGWALDPKRHSLPLAIQSSDGEKLRDFELFFHQALIKGVTDETLQAGPVLLYAVGPGIV